MIREFLIAVIWAWLLISKPAEPGEDLRYHPQVIPNNILSLCDSPLLTVGHLILDMTVSHEYRSNCIRCLALRHHWKSLTVSRVLSAFFSKEKWNPGPGKMFLFWIQQNAMTLRKRLFAPLPPQNNGILSRAASIILCASHGTKDITSYNLLAFEHNTNYLKQGKSHAEDFICIMPELSVLLAWLASLQYWSCASHKILLPSYPTNALRCKE